MIKIITIEIEYFDDADLPEDHRYVACISEGEYKATVVTAGSVADCFKEIGISIFVMDEYRRSLSVDI